MNLCHHAIAGLRHNPTEVLEVLAVNGGKEYDVSILIVNVPACEMAAILPVRDNGTVYFFSMATDPAKALGAEGCGKDVMIARQRLHQDHAEMPSQAAECPAQGVLREEVPVIEPLSQSSVIFPLCGSAAGGPGTLFLPHTFLAARPVSISQSDLERMTLFMIRRKICSQRHRRGVERLALAGQNRIETWDLKKYVS